jgi:DNA-binding transcriptional LysR family regulator
MRNGDFSELAAFIAVAEAGTFTRAAAKLGLSQSAVSYSVRMLEQKLGVRLISRTTRSLSLTDAGQRMLRNLRPSFENIENEIAAITALRDKPSGTIRITTFRYAATSVLWPVVTKFLAEYPDIEMEIILDEGLTDIVADRFDAGIRDESRQLMQLDEILYPVEHHRCDDENENPGNRERLSRSGPCEQQGERNRGTVEDRKCQVEFQESPLGFRGLAMLVQHPPVTGDALYAVSANAHAESIRWCVYSRISPTERVHQPSASEEHDDG